MPSYRLAVWGLLLLGLAPPPAAPSSPTAGAGAVDWAEILGAAISTVGGGGRGGGGGDIDWASIIASAASGGDWSSVVGAALGGHKHSDDPDEEDAAGHFKHTAATHLFQGWLQTLWAQMPEEWGRPVEDLLARFPDPETLFASLENHRARRQWIRPLSGLASHWLKHFARPEVQSSWANSLAIWVGAGGGRWERGRPLEDSLPSLLDGMAKRQLGLSLNTAPYLRPALKYITSLVKTGEGQVAALSAKELDDRLAEGLNSEVIETVLRVWRSYKYSMANPACDAKILCEINSPNHFASSNSTLKPAVTKIASLVSAWFLSGHTGTPFLDLYAAVSENYKCHEKYFADCSNFHEEDFRITTEYYHNEL